MGFATPPPPRNIFCADGTAHQFYVIAIVATPHMAQSGKWGGGEGGARGVWVRGGARGVRVRGVRGPHSGLLLSNSGNSCTGIPRANLSRVASETPSCPKSAGTYPPARQRGTALHARDTGMGPWSRPRCSRSWTSAASSTAPRPPCGWPARGHT